VRPEPDGGGRSESAPWAPAARLLAACAALLALHLFISRGMSVPVLYSDEMGYLANARFLAGVGAVPQLPTPFCHFGYSLLLVPSYWLGATPEGVYRSALALNAVLAVLHFLVLYALGRSLFALERRDACLMALVTSLYPALLLQSSLAWTETLFPLLFSAWVGLAVLADRRPSLGVVLVFVAVGAFLYTTHPRGLAAVPVTLGFAVWLRIRGRIGSTTLLAAVGLQLAGFLLTEMENRRLHQALWSWNTESVATRSLDMLTALGTIAFGSQLVMTVAGQLWYLLCASVGLVVPGAALLVSMLRPRQRRGAEAAVGGPIAPAAVAVLGALGILLVSSLHLSRGDRLDQLVYGRYNEAFLPVFLLAGLVWVLRAQQLRDIRRALGGAGLAIAVLTVLLVLARADELGRPLDMPFTVLGALVFEPGYTADPFAAGGYGRFRPSVVAAGAIVAIAAFAVVVGRSRRLAFAGLGCFFALAALGVASRTLRPVEAWARNLLTLQRAVQESGVAGDIAYDRSSVDWFGMNGYQFYLPERAFRIFDGSTEEPPAALVIASKEWPQAERWGAQRLAVEELLDQALWRVPGPSAD